MITKKHLIAMALISWAGVSTHAEAKDARVHAFDCKTFGGTPVDREFSLQNDSKTQEMHVVCPIQDTSSFRTAEIRTLNIHARNRTHAPIKART